MHNFYLKYGDYTYTENGISLSVSPFLIKGGRELTIAQALKQGALLKKDSISMYTTDASGIRLLITFTDEFGAFTTRWNMIVRLGEVCSIHAQFHEVGTQAAELLAESCFMFITEEGRLCQKIDDIKKLYSPSFLSTLETVNTQSIRIPATMIKASNESTIKRGRFVK